MTAYIEGYVQTNHPLSLRAGFDSLSAVGNLLVDNSGDTMWHRESQLLPSPLRKLRSRARKFADEEIRPLSLKMDLAGHGALGDWDEDSRNLVKLAAKEGFLTDLLPKPFGSASYRALRYLVWAQAIKVEEFCRACGGLNLLLSATHLGAFPIVVSGDLSAIKRFVLPAYKKTKQGDPSIFAFAITEPGAGSDVEEGHGADQYRPRVQAKRDDKNEGWRLNGRKCFISGGDIAETITVFAALEGEGMDSWTCFIVKSGMQGFKVVRNELKMGQRASGASELEFNDVFVPDDHIVGGLRQGWGINRATLNMSRLPVAAMAVGFAQAAVDITQQFVCNTKLGNKRLIDYQEIQLKLAQMIAETSAIRAVLWEKARHFKVRQADSSLCKFHCSDRALEVVNMAMDVIGGQSIVHHNRIEKVFRDVRLTQIYEGTNQINRLAVIEDLQEQLVAGV